jgi:hypothetical protein
MRKRLNLFKRLPLWLSGLIEIALVLLIGYIDYLTGDYSILIFYAIPVGLAAWTWGDWGAISISVLSGYARYLSDINSYSRGKIRYWNSIEDMLFLLIVGLLVAAIKRMLNDEKTKKQ